MAFINEMHLTQTTCDMFDGRRPPRVNMTNGKPYRTKAQRDQARDTAEKRLDGAFRSSAPVSFHKPISVAA